MTDRELMQQALEALEGCEDVTADVLKVITAIRERLAQPEQGPVAAWDGEYQFEIGDMSAYKNANSTWKLLYTTPPRCPNCASLEAQNTELDAKLAEFERREQPEQEPVAWALTRQLDERETTTRGYLWFSDPQNCSWTPLYTTPQPRQWVWLTDEEIDVIFELHCTSLGGWDYSGDEVMYDKHFQNAVVSIEAKLKEKNT